MHDTNPLKSRISALSVLDRTALASHLGASPTSIWQWAYRKTEPSQIIQREVAKWLDRHDRKKA